MTQKPNKQTVFHFGLVLNFVMWVDLQVSNVFRGGHIRMRSSWTANDSKGCNWQQLRREYISHLTSASSFGFSKWSQLSNHLLNHISTRAGGILEGFSIPIKDINGKQKMQTFPASHRSA